MVSEGHTGLCISSFEAFLKSCPGLLFPDLDGFYFFTKFLMPLSSVRLESLKFRVPSLFDRSSLRKHCFEHSTWPSFLAPIQSPRSVWPLSHLWDRATDSSQTSVSILLLSGYNVTRRSLRQESDTGPEFPMTDWDSNLAPASGESRSLGVALPFLPIRGWARQSQPSTNTPSFCTHE